MNKINFKIYTNLHAYKCARDLLAFLTFFYSRSAEFNQYPRPTYDTPLFLLQFTFTTKHQIDLPIKSVLRNKKACVTHIRHTTFPFAIYFYDKTPNRPSNKKCVAKQKSLRDPHTTHHFSFCNLLLRQNTKSTFQ